jgi:hypothetical protein
MDNIQIQYFGASTLTCCYKYSWLWDWHFVSIKDINGGVKSASLLKQNETLAVHRQSLFISEVSIKKYVHVYEYYV